ncbi:MAG: hypothetical protein IKE63_04255 [Bacilli bacterium]|nr:hypothetical protein [Bacilli bacterium]
MRKKIIVILLLPVLILVTFCAMKTFGLLRSSGSATGSLITAEWSVSRNQSESTDSIEVIPEMSTDTYTLTVTSSSEVDVTYAVIINNLPTGVVVKFGDEANYRTPTNGTVRIDNAGTINYNDAVKTKTHTITFRATSSAQTVSDREIDIDVLFKQTL